MSDPQESKGSRGWCLACGWVAAVLLGWVWVTVLGSRVAQHWWSR